MVERIVEHAQAHKPDKKNREVAPNESHYEFLYPGPPGRIKLIQSDHVHFTEQESLRNWSVRIAAPCDIQYGQYSSEVTV